MPIITVTLSNKKKKAYDLSIQSNITAFKMIVTKGINGHDRDRLQEIKIQLEAIQNKNSLILEQLIKIPSIAPPPIPLANPMPVIGPIDSSPMMPVASFEDGESAFQQLYAHLMADMARYTGNIDHLIHYSGLVLNLFMHAATFTPCNGHGKAPLREYNHKSQLQYFRSQGNHPQALFFSKLSKPPTPRAACRLPFNEGFLSLIGRNDFSEKIGTELKKIDPKTGYTTNGSTVSGYVMTTIAHAGARKNNFSTLIQGLRTLTQGCEDDKARAVFQAKIRAILPPATKKITALKPAICAARISVLLTRFKACFDVCETKEFDEQLASCLLNYRAARVQGLADRINNAKLNHIMIDSSQQGITCLMIRLYPSCNIDDDTYREGVTNVLLSFFSGILNHLAQKKGLHIRAERRQSFGFFRPTVTDAGCLMLRLSLGLEPTVFDDVIYESVLRFDALLETYPFNQRDHAMVAKVFEYTKPVQEKKDAERKPRAPDTYIRHAVRKDNLTLQTFNQAGAYIQQAAMEGDDLDYLNRAMRNFLDQYIAQGLLLPLTNSPPAPGIPFVQMIDAPVLKLLRNTCLYTMGFVAKLVFLRENEPLESFGHVYLHSLGKLYNAFQKARELLANIDRMDSSQFHYQALVVTDDLLEYLILLDGLRQIRAALQQESLCSIAQLHGRELAYVEKSLQIPSNDLHLFFTDSGQQAITTALLTLSIELHGPAADGRSYDTDIHLFGKTYYEVAEFIKDCKKDKLQLEMHTLSHAKIVFIDSSQLHLLRLTECRAMRALVIDITHHPLFDNDRLKDVIRRVHAADAHVVLVESSLKHGQLGLDKYQSGKIIVITPPSRPLSRVALDCFEAVSREAMHPSTASYLLIVNAICREKNTVKPPDVIDHDEGATKTNFAP